MTEADKPESAEEAIARIEEIDELFAGATDWGSWMITAANEREGLENRLRARSTSLGINISPGQRVAD